MISDVYPDEQDGWFGRLVGYALLVPILVLVWLARQRAVPGAGHDGRGVEGHQSATGDSSEDEMRFV